MYTRDESAYGRPRERRIPGCIHALIWMVVLSVAAGIHPAFSYDQAEARPVTEVAGVAFDTTLLLNGTRLDLTGAGLLRYRIVFKGYVAALYLESGMGKSHVFFDIPKRLEIEYFHSIAAHGFITATQKGLEANLSPRDLGMLSDRITRLYETYRDVKPGDRYAFTYYPGHGSDLTLNGEVIGNFSGLDFANAILSIWIGENPLDESLKASLLGNE
ncbi:MAG: chalcone isomerase family protein [Desulfomonilia bacterium]